MALQRQWDPTTGTWTLVNVPDARVAITNDWGRGPVEANWVGTPPPGLVASHAQPYGAAPPPVMLSPSGVASGLQSLSASDFNAAPERFAPMAGNGDGGDLAGLQAAADYFMSPRDLRSEYMGDVTGMSGSDVALLARYPDTFSQGMIGPSEYRDPERMAIGTKLTEIGANIEASRARQQAELAQEARWLTTATNPSRVPAKLSDDPLWQSIREASDSIQEQARVASQGTGSFTPEGKAGIADLQRQRLVVDQARSAFARGDRQTAEGLLTTLGGGAPTSSAAQKVNDYLGVGGDQGSGPPTTMDYVNMRGAGNRPAPGPAGPGAGAPANPGSNPFAAAAMGANRLATRGVDALVREVRERMGRRRR